MIEELIKKYQEQKFSSDFAKSSIEALMVNQKLDEILHDLEELKTEYKKVLSDTSDTILNNFLGVDIDD